MKTREQMQKAIIEKVKEDILRAEIWLKHYSSDERNYKAMGYYDVSEASAFYAKQQEEKLLQLFDELAERCK